MKAFLIFECFWHLVSVCVRSISELFSTLCRDVWSLALKSCQTTVALAPIWIWHGLSTCCSPLNNWPISKLNRQWHSSAADPARDSQINYWCLQTYANKASNRDICPHCLRLITLDFLRLLGCWNERKGSCFFEKWNGSERHKGIASCNSVACHYVWGVYYIMRHMEWFMHAWAAGNDAFAVQRTIQFKGNS